MVRKIIALFLCVLFAASVPLAANAETYSAFVGDFDHSQAEYFKSLLNDVSIFDDYVLYRSGTSVYSMIVGDLDYSGQKFTSSEECIVFELSSYTLISYTVSTVDLTVGDQIYYSNLGFGLDLYSRLDVFGFLAVLILFVIALCCLIRPMFNFVLRLRGRS